MKIPEKQFRIYSGERPRVLLLGNGLCRAYGGLSWDGLLDEIKDERKYPDKASNYIMPMPLKAVMLTNNSLAKRMRRITEEKAKNSNTQIDCISWDNFTKTTIKMQEAIRKVVGLGFDYVLTTNYSYEIEASLSKHKVLTKSHLQAMMNYHEVDNPQTKFLINTYNLASSVPVWHIHGEARKPDSMVIGSYYYGKVLRRCVERLDGRTRVDSEQERTGKGDEFRNSIKNKRVQKIGSWIDAFVLGDVYILGFGLDFSEMDLWWLIEYKSNHRDICGKTVFYTPKRNQFEGCLMNRNIFCNEVSHFIGTEQCRDYLLTESYKVDVKNLGIEIRNEDDYREFYESAINDLEPADRW